MSENMQPSFYTISEKKLIGLKINMSLNADKTFLLWNILMPRRKEIINSLSSELYSIRNYENPGALKSYDKDFEKWAAVEVENFDFVPVNMETFILQAGQYAVFHYKGSNTDHSIFYYIYQTWLPTSGYQLDDRPHFEVMGEKYKNNDVNSEEDIWIPVKAI